MAAGTIPVHCGNRDTRNPHTVRSTQLGFHEHSILTASIHYSVHQHGCRAVCCHPIMAQSLPGNTPQVHILKVEAPPLSRVHGNVTPNVARGSRLTYESKTRYDHGRERQHRNAIPTPSRALVFKLNCLVQLISNSPVSEHSMTTLLDQFARHAAPSCRQNLHTIGHPPL